MARTQALPEIAAGTGDTPLPRRLRDFRDRHAGETIVVCGCGRSLLELPEPESLLTIGVNDVGRLFQPTYLVVLNPKSQFKGDRFRHVVESSARAVFTQLAPERDLGGLRHPQVVRFSLGKRGGTDLSSPDTLPYTRNSPYVAVCLAAFLGAKRIGLIGVDFTDHHFFGQTGRHPLARELARIDDEYARIGKSLAERGVELVNLSPESRLEALPKVRPATFLQGDAPAGPVPVAARPPEPEVEPLPQAPAAAPPPRVFFVHYQFLSCGDVFTCGLEHAADDLGLAWAGTSWDDPHLPAKVERFRPDLLFVVHGRRFRQRWGNRFPDVRKAVWLLDEPYEVDDTERTSRLFDVVFLNDPSTRDRHRNAHYLPVAWDPHVHIPGTEGAHRYDVGFVGGGNPTRETMLLRLAREGLLSYVVGGPWKARELQALSLGQNVPPERTGELYRQTRLVINVFRDRHHYNRRHLPATTLNPRVYEALACGALVVSEKRPELAEVFPELPTFSEADELVAAVRGLLASPEGRQQLLAASRERLASHTYAERLRTVLATALPGVPAPVGDEPMGVADDAQPPAPCAASLPAGWRAVGETSVLVTTNAIVLEKPEDHRPASEGGLASDQSFRGVELAFELELCDSATFVAKLHQQDRDDQATNSYHLMCRPEQAYLARHHQILQQVHVPRRRWLSVVMRWHRGRLELIVDRRRLAALAESTLESGYCFLGIKGGQVRLRNVRILQLDQPCDRPEATPRGRYPDQVLQRLLPLPFSRTPVRHLLYHVWPVKGSNWRWNLEQLEKRIDLFNGRRIVGIVFDQRSEPPEEVMCLLDGHGCEFVVEENDSAGEVVTFSKMLPMVSSIETDEVTFYGHAKGVKYGSQVTSSVMRWAEVQYCTTLDDWPTVREQLHQCALTGPMRIFGRFRAHRNLTDWHYTGTFFWMRHSRVFTRPVFDVPRFYGGVEVWPGLYFSHEESGCLFIDDLPQLPYLPRFWSRVGDPAFARWRASRRASQPPPDLAKPEPFDGHTWPRAEQKPEELRFWIDTLLAADVRRLLSIGVMHGGVEWHVARVFRQHGKDVEIVGIDRAERLEATRSFQDAAERFGQSMRLVVGVSASPDIRRQLADQYDAVFVDGDHTYRGAHNDWELARALGARVVGFHDIVDSDWHAANRCCVSRLWAEIKSAHKTQQCFSGAWGGIGVVRL